MKKRSKYLFISGAVVLLLLINIFPEFQHRLRSGFISSTSKISAGLTQLGWKTKKTFSFVTNINNLKRQNDDLSQKLIALQVDSSQIEELKKENSLLKKELGFVDPANTSLLLPAKVIEKDPTGFIDDIVIDKGESEGVKKGMAVIAGGTLVGQVREVFERNCTVTMITSKDSIIQAMLQNSRSKGILRGGISGLYVENIMTDAEYTIGENVVTSGLGGDLPAGLLIGRAGKLASSSSSIFKTIEIEPIVEISNLELVFIRK